MRIGIPIAIVIALLGWSLLGSAQETKDLDERFQKEACLSDHLKKLFQQTKLDKEYRIDVSHLPLYYLWGDFDGDRKQDYMVRLESTQTGKEPRFAVIRGNGKVSWLDRDKQLQYPPPTAWYVVPKAERVGKSHHDGRPPPKEFKGDKVMFIKLEASSSLVYWNGKRFVYYWQGD